MIKDSLAPFIQTIIRKLRNQPPAKLLLIAFISIALLGVLFKTAGSLRGVLFPARYTPCPDLSVEITAVSNNRGYFMVQNTGSQVISDFALSYVGFDSNGNPVELGYNKDKYAQSTYTSANILPGQVYGPWDSHNSFSLDSGVKYVVATVSAVTYKNGREWAAKGLSKWARDAEKEFSVDGYTRFIEHMRTDAAKAESASEVVITNSQKYRDNRFSNDDDLKISIKNTGQSTVKDIHFLILQ